jgi:hypothetical protein
MVVGVIRINKGRRLMSTTRMEEEKEEGKMKEGPSLIFKVSQPERSWNNKNERQTPTGKRKYGSCLK